MGIKEKLLKNEPRYLVGFKFKEGDLAVGGINQRNALSILSKKNLTLLIIIGILVSGIPAVTLCSSYCVSNALDLDSPMDGSCPFSDHSFVQIVIVLSALFVLPLAGLFLVRDRQFIPPGVYLPLFKPPRFSH